MRKHRIDLSEHERVNLCSISWGGGVRVNLMPKTQPEALTILTQVQLGQAPAIKGLLKDGAGVAVAHSVQVHGFVLHRVLQPQQEREGGHRGERKSVSCRWRQK